MPQMLVPDKELPSLCRQLSVIQTMHYFLNKTIGTQKDIRTTVHVALSINCSSLLVGGIKTSLHNNHAVSLDF